MITEVSSERGFQGFFSYIQLRFCSDEEKEILELGGGGNSNAREMIELLKRLFLYLCCFSISVISYLCLCCLRMCCSNLSQLSAMGQDKKDGAHTPSKGPGPCGRMVGGERLGVFCFIHSSFPQHWYEGREVDFVAPLLNRVSLFGLLFSHLTCWLLRLSGSTQMVTRCWYVSHLIHSLCDSLSKSDCSRLCG